VTPLAVALGAETLHRHPLGDNWQTDPVPGASTASARLRGRQHLEAKQHAILQAFDLITRERGLEPFAARADASAQVRLRSAGWAMVLLAPDEPVRARAQPSGRSMQRPRRSSPARPSGFNHDRDARFATFWIWLE